jgi:5S rRNA maturation endonuclease (ribonuclease M5)
MRNRGYIDGVDQLIEQTSVEEVLSHFGQPLPEKTTGEHRMKCVFREECHNSSYGSMTVDLSDPAYRIYCHVCGTRGNLLTLIHGLANHRPPTGDKLRGSEFKEAVQTLQEIHGRVQQRSSEDARPRVATPPPSKEPEPPAVNIPLKDSENVRARELVHLWEDLIADPAEMSPAAAAYFRKRPWLTPEVARKWKMGYLPHSGKSLLRGLVVYAYLDERGEVLSYFGRDPDFERKEAEWIKNGRTEKSKPVKTRFVKGFHRGLELYGQHASRLKDRQIKESLAKHGLVIVEGPNDVMRLDCLGVAAVGLCSNRATDEQIEKIVRFAKAVANGKVLLLPDLDDEGEAGCKELLWKLCQGGGINVRLGWPSRCCSRNLKNRQPEDLSDEDLLLLMT